VSRAAQEVEVSPLLREAVQQALTGPASGRGWINAILADPAAPAAVREAVEEELGRWRPNFPSAQLVGVAAALVPTEPEPAGPEITQREGPRHELVIGPGVLQLRTVDWAKHARTLERNAGNQTKDASALAGWIADQGGLEQVQAALDKGDPTTVRVLRGRKSTREIKGWSRKSRNNLDLKLSKISYDPLFRESKRCLDCGATYGIDVQSCPAAVTEQRDAVIDGNPVTYRLKGRCGSRRYDLNEPGLPCMVTLTEPSVWLGVAPNGKASTDHLRSWGERFDRAWGERWAGVWKREFMDATRDGLQEIKARIEEAGGQLGSEWADRAQSLTWADAIELAQQAPSLLYGLQLGRPHFHMHLVTPTGLSGGDRGFVADLTRSQILELTETDPESLRHCDLGGLPFVTWLSLSWAQIVNHPDSHEFGKHIRAGTGVDRVDALRASDPKRLAQYFLKRHSQGASKEYQHVVPEAWQQPGQGPGRFWGVRGMDDASAAVHISVIDFNRAGRLLRRWSRTQATVRWTRDRNKDGTTLYPHLIHEANTDPDELAEALTKPGKVPRVRGGRADSKYPEVIGLAGAQLLASRAVILRNCRSRPQRMRNNHGWVAINDGAAAGSQVARWLDIAEATGVQTGNQQ
jgi:hypothetical protein